MDIDVAAVVLNILTTDAKCFEDCTISIVVDCVEAPVRYVFVSTSFDRNE